MKRSEAFELFGEMRSSTDEEKKLYADMLARLGERTGLSIFDDGAPEQYQSCSLCDSDAEDELPCEEQNDYEGHH